MPVVNPLFKVIKENVINKIDYCARQKYNVYRTGHSERKRVSDKVF